MFSRQTLAELGKSVAGRSSASLHALLGSRANGAFGILMYHRLARCRAHVEPPTWNVAPETFRRQMEGLRGRGYQFWSLSGVLDHVATGRELPERTTVVTFDDGYHNVFLNAFPILKTLGLPATIFVATAYIDTPLPFAFDRWSCSHWGRVEPELWQPLTWDECREMEGSRLIEIGSHAHTHRNFQREPEAFKADLVTSVQVLRKQLGERQYTFSFPYGSREMGFSDRPMIEAARETGIRCALTTDTGLVYPRADPFGWGRMEVTESDTGGTLAAKLEGWYNWTGPARKVFRSVVPYRTKPVTRAV